MFVPILLGVSSLGASAVFSADGADKHVVYVVGSTGVTAGAVTLEASHDAAYSGTWDTLATVAVPAGAVDSVVIDAPHRFVRARVSTAVVGGTVSVYVSQR